MTNNSWVGDALIAGSYFTIPIALMCVVIKSKQTFCFQKVMVLFALFIALCGGGHAIDAWSLWNGQCAAGSRLKVWWDFGTAGASFATMVVVVRNAGRYIELANRPYVIEELEAQIADLEKRVNAD